MNQKVFNINGSVVAAKLNFELYNDARTQNWTQERRQLKFLITCSLKNVQSKRTDDGVTPIIIQSIKHARDLIVFNTLFLFWNIDFLFH